MDSYEVAAVDGCEAKIGIKAKDEPITLAAIKCMLAAGMSWSALCHFVWLAPLQWTVWRITGKIIRTTIMLIIYVRV